MNTLHFSLYIYICNYFQYCLLLALTSVVIHILFFNRFVVLWTLGHVVHYPSHSCYCTGYHILAFCSPCLVPFSWVDPYYLMEPGRVDEASNSSIGGQRAQELTYGAAFAPPHSCKVWLLLYSCLLFAWKYVPIKYYT